MSNPNSQNGEIASYADVQSGSPFSLVVETAEKAAEGGKNGIPIGEYVSAETGDTISIQAGFIIGVIDFTPLGLKNKDNKSTLEVLSMGLASFPELVKWIKAMPANKQPSIIIGKTNPFMAQFAQKRLGFEQLSSPLGKKDNQIYIAIYTENLIRLFDEQGENYKRAKAVVARRLGETPRRK